jgi:hypothetical protein
MTTAKPLARYGAMWRARVATGSATTELHHAAGHDRQQCIGEPSDEKTYRRMASELRRLGLEVSDGDVRRTAIGGGKTDPDSPTPPQSKLSWIGFVTTELLALFTVTPGPAGAAPQYSHATSAPV